jgi:hypothetical protein
LGRRSRAAHATLRSTCTHSCLRTCTSRGRGRGYDARSTGWYDGWTVNFVGDDDWERACTGGSSLSICFELGVRRYLPGSKSHRRTHASSLACTLVEPYGGSETKASRPLPGTALLFMCTSCRMATQDGGAYAYGSRAVNDIPALLRSAAPDMYGFGFQFF